MSKGGQLFVRDKTHLNYITDGKLNFINCIFLRTNSNLCHIQHKLVGFITQMKSVYSAVRTGALNKAVCHSSLKGVSLC